VILSIISWLFSKNTEKSSLVRKWVAQEIKKVDTANPDVYALFVGLLQAAVQCGKYSIEEQDDQLLQVSKQYLGDATIFEIACYTHYRVENWLEKNQPELTAEITLPIRGWIVEKFHTALYVDEGWISQLFDEQIVRYKTITGTGKGIEELHLELEQRILMTKGDKFDKRTLSKDLIGTALECRYIKHSLAIYEETYITVVLASMQEYCKNNTKKQLAQKQNKNQTLEENQDQRDYLYGMALVAQQDWVRACKAFTKVLSINPKHYDALIQRGLLHCTLYQYVDALQDFTAAMEIKPSEPAAYLHRGKCYHRNLRQKEKSLSDYSEAIRLAPSAAAAYFGRGELYDEIALYNERQAHENNDLEKYTQVSEELWAAIHDYSQVIALEPEHDAAYANRGLAYARKARANKNVDFIVKSIADFEKAMNLNWEHGHLYKQQDEMKELLAEISQTEGQADVQLSIS
jgi:tetratricopeptide (TPR) repeat protein